MSFLPQSIMIMIRENSGVMYLQPIVLEDEIQK